MTASSSFPLLLLLFSRCRQTFRPVEGGAGKNSNAVVFLREKASYSECGRDEEGEFEGVGRSDTWKKPQEGAASTYDGEKKGNRAP